MKKKIILLSVSALLATGTIAAAALAFNGEKTPDAAFGTDYYTITINAEDVTSSTTPVSGTYVAHTDQLGNPVTFNYANVKFEQDGEDKYLVFGEDAWIANDKDWQIRNLSSVTVRGENGAIFDYDYGWELSAGEIVYTGENLYDWIDSEGIVVSVSDGQNYFKLAHRPSSDPLRVSQIVFSYGKDCTAGENPYIVQGGLKYKKHASYAQLIGFAGASFANVTVADEVDGLPVTAIDHHAFYNDTTIETIDLGANVYLINNDAFNGCYNLTNVTGLENVTTFYNYAFESCSALAIDVVFNEDISYLGAGSFMYSGLTSVSFSETCDPYVSEYAFRFMDNLTSVHLGQSMSYTSDFYQCPELTEITVTNGNEHLHASENVLFNGSTVIRIAQKRAETSFTLPDNHYLSTYCGYGAETLETLVLNNQETRVPDYSFSNCTSLTSITFGNHADFEINMSFNNCDALETITIPSNVTAVYQKAFADCDELKTVIFEEGCLELSRGAFKDCPKLEKVLLPSTLTHIGESSGFPSDPTDVFDGCTSLRKILTRLEDGEDYVGTIEAGWDGGRPLVKHSDSIKDVSHWRMDATYGPQAWQTTVLFKAPKTDVGSGYAVYLLGINDDWMASESNRMTHADGVWSIEVTLDTLVAQEFKLVVSTWDSPTAPYSWEFDGDNRSWTPLDTAYEYIIHWGIR